MSAIDERILRSQSLDIDGTIALLEKFRDAVASISPRQDSARIYVTFSATAFLYEPEMGKNLDKVMPDLDDS